MYTLYEHAARREYDRFKLQASLAGIDLEGETEFGEIEPRPSSKKENLWVFKDPSEYEHLSQEEKEELTRKMKGVHQQWASNSPIGRGL